MRQGMTSALALGLGLIAIVGSGRASDAPWSLPDEARGSRVAPLFLLSRPEVRDDLRIDPALIPEVDRAIVDLFAKAKVLRGQTGAGAVEGRRLVDEGQKAWLEAHLTPDQVDRLWQVDLLWEGPAAIATRPSIAEALSLSDEQKAAFRKALAERQARHGRGGNGEVAAANHQFGERALTILDDGQKQRWAKLVVRPIAHKPAPAAAAAATTATARGAAPVAR